MQGLGWRLVRTMATSGITPSTALDAIRQQKKALRTIVRRQLRNLSPDVKHQEGKLPSLIAFFVLPHQVWIWPLAIFSVDHRIDGLVAFCTDLQFDPAGLKLY